MKADICLSQVSHSTYGFPSAIPLQDRFSTARKICFKALGKLALGQGADDEPAGSYQAFMKMLRIWTASLVLQLMVVFRERMRDAP